MGTVVIDATRIKASASPDNTVKQRYVKVRAMRRATGGAAEGAALAAGRRCDYPNENAGNRVDAPLETVEQMPATPGKLPRTVREKTVRRSVTDPDAHFLRAGGGRSVLGYTAEIGASKDHLIVAQRVTQGRPMTLRSNPWWT
jgi:hypothetical protein